MDEKLFLPTSVFLSALILAGTIFIVGSGISTQMADLKTGLSVLGTANTGNTGNNGDTGNTQPSGDTGNNQPIQPTPAIDLSKLADDDPVEGNANAPVTIVEFSDFQCPFCESFYTNTLQQIRKDYVDTGKVKLIFRDFPLSFHPHAQKSAEAAECANLQGKYWEMHDKLFENQTSLDNSSDYISDLKRYAADLKLDTAKFNSCLDNGDTAAEISKDFNDGAAAGISGTPSFFINGQKIVGAQPYSAFKAAIDAELAKAA
jgi:protein-disulfide isomerase